MHGIFLTDFDNLYEELNSLYETSYRPNSDTAVQAWAEDIINKCPNKSMLIAYGGSHELGGTNWVPLSPDTEHGAETGIYVIKRILDSNGNQLTVFPLYIGKAGSQNGFRSRCVSHFNGDDNNKAAKSTSMLHNAIKAVKKASFDVAEAFQWCRLLTFTESLVNSAVADKDKQTLLSALEAAAIKQYGTYKGDFYKEDPSYQYDGISYNLTPGGDGGGPATKLVGSAKDYVEQEFKAATIDAKNYDGRANPYYTIRAIAERTVANYGAMYDFDSIDDTTIAKYNKSNQWLSKDQINRNSSAATAFITSQPGILKINNEVVGGLTLNGVPTGWYPSLSLIARAILNVEKENSPQALYNLKKNIQKNFSRNKNKKEFITRGYTIIKAEPKTVEEIYGPDGQKKGAYIDIKDGKKR